MISVLTLVAVAVAAVAGPALFFAALGSLSGLSSPIRLGFRRARITMEEHMRKDSMMPGRSPAISSLTMEVSVSMPNMTKVMLGGIMMPSVPPPATVPIAKASV